MAQIEVIALNMGSQYNMNRRRFCTLLEVLLIGFMVFFFIMDPPHRSNERPVFRRRETALSSVFADNTRTRSCLTRNILREVPELQTVRYSIGEDDEIENTLEEAFDNIYKKRIWTRTSNNSRSGSGSSIDYTYEINAILHIVINELKAILGKERISILDIPCGDLIWMERFLMDRDDVDYTGMDIVPDLIASHRKQYSNTKWKFIDGNILKVGPVHFVHFWQIISFARYLSFTLCIRALYGTSLRDGNYRRS